MKAVIPFILIFALVVGSLAQTPTPSPSPRPTPDRTIPPSKSTLDLIQRAGIERRKPAPTPTPKRRRARKRSHHALLPAVIPVASGANLQTAITGASCGDTLELEAGATWDGTFTIAQNCTAGNPLTIRSANYLLLPNGRLGNNTISDTLSQSGNMARIRTLAGGSFGAAFVTGTNAGGLVLDGLEITDNAATSANVHAVLDFGLTNVGAHDIIVDRCWIHQKETGVSYNRTIQRALWAEGTNITLKRSYVYLIGYYYAANPTSGGASDLQMDTCGFLSVAGPGPFTIEDNFISVWWNGVFQGGGDTAPAHTATLTSSSTTSATFSSVTGLVAGVVVRFSLAGTGTWDNTTKILTRTSGPVLTSSDGGNFAEGAGTSIVLTPSGGGASSVNCHIGFQSPLTGVVGNAIPIGGNNTSVGVSGNYDWVAYQTATVDSVVDSTVNYTPFGIDQLRHAPSAAGWCVGDEGLIHDTLVQRNTFMISAAFASAIFTAKGYLPKGWIEIKNAKRFTVNANRWYGYPSNIAFYAINQNGSAPWITTDNITITNNWIAPDTGFTEGVRQAITLNEGSYLNTTTPATTWNISNNFVKNLRSFLQTVGAHGAVIDHNTIINDQATAAGYNSLVGGVGTSNNFTFKNNIGLYVLYGMQPVTFSFAVTWPSGVFLNNVVVDTAAVGYSTAEWGAGSILSPIPTTIAGVGFTNAAAEIYSLDVTSNYKNDATDGTDPGVNFAALLSALGGSGTPVIVGGKVTFGGKVTAQE